MKRLLLFFCLFCLPALGFATPLNLAWDAVTKNTDGTPAGAVVYHLYKKTPTGPYLLLASRISTTYTWQVPQLGTWIFTVRAKNKYGESLDSNTVKVQVDPCWTEIKNE